jgi:hypothetical protein
MPETLAQKTCLAIETFIINHVMIFIVLGLLYIIVIDFYNRYFRINRNTDHIDLMREYNNLQLRRKYERK